MRRVLCFGEALVDFLNTGRQDDGQLSLNNFTQYPGGAPANAAVAVAKLGGSAVLAGQVGNDQFGHFLIQSLQHYGVDTSFVAVHSDAPTPLAFVFLDEQGERSFSFRRRGTADIVFSKEQVTSEWFVDAPVVHLCSNTLTDGQIADVTDYVVTCAGQANAIVSFDVNLRHNLWPSGRADATQVNALVAKADVVKFSRDELNYLCNGDSQGYLRACFEQGVAAALITDGPNDLEVCTARSRKTLTPPDVRAVDTTGGGDAFIGAVLYGLSLQEDIRAFLDDMLRLESLVAFATQCGALAVSRAGAFPSFPTADDVAGMWDA